MNRVLLSCFAVFASSCGVEHAIGVECPHVLLGAVAAWELNEAQGSVASDSAAAHHATLCAASSDGYDVNGVCVSGVDQPTWLVEPVATGVSFDGQNDGLTVPFTPALDLPVISIEARFRWEGKGKFDQQRIVERTRGSSQGGIPVWSLSVTDTGAAVVELRVGSDSASAVQASLRSDDGLVLFGQWTHLVASFDGKVLRLFYGGRAVADQAAVGTLLYDEPANQREGIGLGNEWARNRPFHGVIDFVRLYARPLSADDVNVLAPTTP